MNRMPPKFNEKGDSRYSDRPLLEPKEMKCEGDASRSSRVKRFFHSHIVICSVLRNEEIESKNHFLIFDKNTLNSAVLRPSLSGLVAGDRIIEAKPVEGDAARVDAFFGDQVVPHR